MVTSLLAAALVAGSTMRAAPDQVRPGEMTEAKVWIQNRNRAEAIPVDLRDVNLETPLRVQVANGETNPHSVRVAGPIRVQLLKQEWDYDTLVIAAGTSAVQALKSPGLAGWETTGIAWTAGEQTTLLLKRPR
jgi:NADH dehydrogenase FAD-containing subunit